MNLSNDILSSFAKAVKPVEKDADVTLLGTVIRIDSNPQYAVVLIDGSSDHTVARIGAVVNPQDRVSVLFRNHRAIITANLSSPASSSSESQYIRVLPDGTFVIGRIDEQGHPLGFYIQATDTHYKIIDPSDNDVILDVTSSGVSVNGSEVVTADNIGNYIRPLTNAEIDDIYDAVFVTQQGGN